MKEHAKSAFEITDEAVHLLRLLPVSVLSAYYIGTLPFVLGFLYFWGEMSQSALAEEYCSIFSLGLALLFVWMKVWQVFFLRHIRNRLMGRARSRMSFGRILRVILTQTIIQTSGFIVIPVSILLTIPLPWCYGFYQNISALDNGESHNIKAIYRRAWHQAKLWPLQNCILVSVFSLFSLIVFLNLFTAIFFLPHLLKKFFGIETLLTMNEFSILNSTFLAVACGLTYLCTDPLIKTVYALRCFYGESLASGEDLKVGLKNISGYGKVLAAAMIVFLWLPVYEASGNSESSRNLETKALSSDELDRSIKEVMRQQKFRWRMPREELRKKEKEVPGPFDSLMEWLRKGIIACRDTLKRWIRSIGEWLGKSFPSSPRHKKNQDSDWRPGIRGYLMVLFFLLIVIGAVFLWRIRKRHRLEQARTETQPILSSPDLTDDDIEADALPSDRWLALAGELLEKGELRTALRAFYLATLAILGEHQLISIAKYKSNREYEKELYRRTHEKPSLLSAFSMQVSFFDSAWYGMYELSRQDVDAFAQHHGKITKELKIE
jgi:hypothetical protein